MEIKNFSADLLQIFIKVADEGSISQAAEALYLDPSSISRRLKNLESNVGTELLSRSAKGVTLTQAGKLLYDFALNFLKNLTELEGQLMSQPLAFGTYDSIASSTYAGYFARHLTDFREIFISNDTKLLTDRFNRGKLEALIMDQEFGADLTGDFSEKNLFEEAYFLLSKNLVKDDLSQLKLILYPSSCPIHHKVLENGLAESQLKVIDFAESTVSFVRKSDYSTILPAALAQKYANELQLVQLPERFNRQIALFTRFSALDSLLIELIGYQEANHSQQ